MTQISVKRDSRRVDIESEIDLHVLNMVREQKQKVELQKRIFRLKMTAKLQSCPCLNFFRGVRNIYYVDVYVC
ncbi:unnamed protein product [Arabidopsis halleri]